MTASPGPSGHDDADAEVGEAAKPEDLPAPPDAAAGGATAVGRAAASRAPAEPTRPLQTDAGGGGSNAAVLPAESNASAVSPSSVPMTSG